MERISALMDGELDVADAGRELARVGQQPELREHWETFHLIGDAMRGSPLLSPRFSARLAEELAREPTILAPQRRKMPSAVNYALSAAASLCAVAVVAWVALSGTVPGNGSLDNEPVVAQAPAASSTLPVSETLLNVPADGSMPEYLLAHQGVSPSTVLQGVAPYVRTVVEVSQDSDNR